MDLEKYKSKMINICVLLVLLLLFFGIGAISEGIDAYEIFLFVSIIIPLHFIATTLNELDKSNGKIVLSSSQTLEAYATISLVVIEFVLIVFGLIVSESYSGNYAWIVFAILFVLPIWSGYWVIKYTLEVLRISKGSN